ncbi:hypothetical protein V866_004856 [Kwoniella sp. B9012]
MSKSSFRLNWETDPSLTFTLLSLIKSIPLYQQVFFSTSIEQVKDKYFVTQKICIEFFRDSVWMKDAERRGLVIKTEGGEWKATKKWGSNVANPITSRVLHLRKRFNDGWYMTKCGILLNYIKIEDFPDRRRRMLFKKQHPYYFLLRELCQGRQPQAGLPIITPVEERSDPPTGRRKRSLSTISSDSSDSEEDNPLSTHAAPPLAKRLRESPSDIRFIREAVTPLRALSISLPPEIPPHDETQIHRLPLQCITPILDVDIEASVAPPSPAPSHCSSVVALSIAPAHSAPCENRSVSKSRADVHAMMPVMYASIDRGQHHQKVKSTQPTTPEWDELVDEIKRNPKKIPYKTSVLLHMSLKGEIKRVLGDLAWKVDFTTCRKPNEFYTHVTTRPISQRSIKVFTQNKKGINAMTDYRKKKGKAKVMWMTPMGFLQFLKEEQETG